MVIDSQNFRVGKDHFHLQLRKQGFAQATQPAEGTAGLQTQPSDPRLSPTLSVSKLQTHGLLGFLRHILWGLEVSMRNFKSIWYIFIDNHLDVHLTTKVQSHDFRAYVWFYVKFEPSEGQMISQHMVQGKFFVVVFGVFFCFCFVCLFVCNLREKSSEMNLVINPNMKVKASHTEKNKTSYQRNEFHFLHFKL